MYQQFATVLQEMNLFQGILPSDLLTMLNCLKPRVVDCRKNSVIVMQGEAVAGIYVILSGRAAVAKENADGSRIITMVLLPGELFGEMTAFIGGNHWEYTVIAQEHSRVLILPAERVAGVCPNQCVAHRKLLNNMLKLLSEKALLLNKRVECLSLKSLRSRIAVFLLEQVKLHQSREFQLQLNRNEIADYLGVARPSLSRELSRMRQEGIVDFDKSWITIKDLIKVEHLAFQYSSDQ